MTEIVDDRPDAEKDADLMMHAQEIAELLIRAVKLHYTLTLAPEQMKTLIAICEEISLVKERRP